MFEFFYRNGKMWSPITIVLSLLAALALAKAAPPYKIPGTNSLFLGIVDGKGYLADDSAPMSWTAAKEHCDSLGMRLGGVETAVEKNFIAAINNSQFVGLYWTAGRDARSPHQFVWDDNSKLVSENFDSLDYYTSARSCLLLWSQTGGNKRYESFYCEEALNANRPVGAFCESI